MDIEDNVTAIISTTNLTNVTTLLYLSAVPVTVLFVVGVLGNVFALSLVCYDAKSHKWRPFYRFVCALAISDGGGILASYSIAEYRYISKFNYEFSESLCNYLGFVFMFTLMSSAMIVCCMSLDRFFAIFFPIHYSSPSKGFRTNVIIAVVYCLSGILSSLHLYGLGSIKNFYPGSWCFLNFIYVNSSNSQDTQNKIYSYIYAITGLVVVSLIVVVNSVVVIYFIRNRCILKKSISSTRDLEIIVFLLIIVVVFTSFWAPFTVWLFFFTIVL